MVSLNQFKQTTDMNIAYMKNSVQRDTAKVQQMVQQWLLQNPSRSHTNNLHEYEYNYKDHCILAITVYQLLRHGHFSKDVQRHSHLQRRSYKLAFTDHNPHYQLQKPLHTISTPTYSTFFSFVGALGILLRTAASNLL
jgi:hypothetical protein